VPADRRAPDFVPTRAIRPGIVCGLAAMFALAAPSVADAYIGPGAGFVLLSSFFAFLTTLAVAFVSLLAWPFRMAVRAIRRPARGPAQARRLIVVGFDGQDPSLTDRFMTAGRLPNFSRLAAMGSYSRLRTTFPSVSPVAWSSFSTGTNPGRHNIFDFLDRDRRTYLPVLSSTRIGSVDRVLRLGRYRIPLGKPEIRSMRKSKPFWSVLGEHGIWSTILRVPISFPPDRFYGAQLGAMSIPDLRGTQGTFTVFTTRPSEQAFKEGGQRVPIVLQSDRFEARLEGPENSMLDGAPTAGVPIRGILDREQKRLMVEIDGSTVSLQPGRLSDWIQVRFRLVPAVSVTGICRLLVTEMAEHVSLYVSPINIDPDRPAMPIAHPPFYATYLAKRIGKYATLGLAEDTWALNEGVIRTEDFLTQTYDIDREREAMFFAGLERLRSGALVCVFDATDRIQHMCWRQSENGAAGSAIEQLYAHNDALLGRVMAKLGPDDVLLVLSDHGFTAFRRGVNLNSWLLANGYLSLKPGASGSSEWLRDVDWTRTRAFALGLTGMFLNLQGRESGGIVSRDQVASLKTEIISRLSGLEDTETGDVAIREVFDTARLYSGPYAANAPDFLIGYNSGYRISWDSATGVVSGPVFEDNRKAWSGDHSVDPRLVPGVLFSSRRIQSADPALIDIAPTALRLFGIEPPKYMEGVSLFHPAGAEG
jgi:predicted AlkP superfamily phosphohydrolase/phosphomutase